MQQNTLQDNKFPAFSTFPIANSDEIVPDSKVTIPTKDDVTQAGEFVNENKK